MRELIQKTDDAREHVKDYPEYEIEGKLNCYLALSDDTFECNIVKIFCSNNRSVEDWYRKLEKNCGVGYTQLGYKLSYPMYCLIDEHLLSLEEIVILETSNFFLTVNIEL